MMHQRLYTLVFLILLSFYSAAQHTDTALHQLMYNLKQMHELNPLEKCFLHTDKKFYQSGEKIWFSAYLLLNHKPSTLSSVIYTDLTDNKGILLAKDMWQTKDGVAEGLISLSDTLKTGIYRLRSYSLWMLNEPYTIHEQYLFVQGREEQHKIYQVKPGNITASFFPESGAIVSSVNNRMAFLFSDTTGYPQQIESVQLLENNIAIESNITLFEAGFGMLNFTPIKDRTYSLSVLRNGKIISFDLPRSVDNAMTLQVSNFSPTRIFIQLNASDAFIQENKQVHIIALQQGIPVFQSVFKLEEGQNATLIPKKGLRKDLLQVVVFNQHKQPLAQRWIQVHMKSEQTLTIKETNISKKAKEKSRIKLAFTGIDTPNVSVSVIPADLLEPTFLYHPRMFDYIHFRSHQSTPLWLPSPETGISDSSWYVFSDAMLMTIKPERFRWADIKNMHLSKLNYFYETGISLRGFIKNEKSTDEPERVDIITKGVDSTTILSTVTPDERGAFAVNDLAFRKRASVFAQGTSTDKKKNRLELKLLPGYIDTLRTVTRPTYIPMLEEKTVSSDSVNLFLRQYAVSGLGKTMDEIVITGKRKLRIDSLNEVYASDLYRLSDYTYELDSNFSYATIWQALMELVPGLYVSSATANEPMVSFNRYTLTNDRIAGEDGTSSVAPVPIAFFLNEVPVNLFEISSVNPSDVALIKVNRSANLLMNSGSMYSGAEGSILIYTKKNTYGSKRSFDETSLTGYSIPIPFQQPNYEIESQRKPADRRTTLYWEPRLRWNQDGTADIVFFNNDYPSKFKLVIQGVDKNGKLYFLESIVE